MYVPSLCFILRFAKNVDPDQIRLSALRGELSMENLELNEEVLMELLAFPKWLRIKSAICAHIYMKIPWTNLRSRPIVMIVDSVTVKVEVLEKAHQMFNGGFVSSYRASSGRYGMVERVIDGISIRIHELDVELRSKLFKAAANFSHISISSKKPNWEPGPLNFAFLPLPERNSILLFKEVSWESTRFEADGLDDRMTPVKIITNRAHLRVTLKKRISDSSFVCGKMVLLVESLLWVLTVSQLEAAIVFLKSIKYSVQLSAELAKGDGSNKTKPTSGPCVSSSMVPRVSSQGQPDPRLIRYFEFYDVKEDSFHLQASLIETHFCEDALRASSVSTQLASGGSVRMTLRNLNFDHYPAHPRSAPRTEWSNYSEIGHARSQWLQSLKPNSDPDRAINRRIKSTEVELYESVIVFRLQDITATCVMLENQQEDERWPLLVRVDRAYKRRTIIEAFDGEQRSLASNTFFASDTEMHRLPAKSNLISIDLTQCFAYGAIGAALPIILYAQVNPLHLKFDVDTMIWLNAFFLSLTTNLNSLFGEPEEPIEQKTSLPFFCRAEALMPRVVFPLHPPPPNFDNSSNYPWTGPSALVVQVDTVILQTVPKPLTTSMTKTLVNILDKLEKQIQPPPTWGREHTPPDLPQFKRFTDLELSSPSSEDEPKGLLVCIHCPILWAEFLTICEAAKRHPTSSPSFKTYRQAFLDPSPLTCWALLPSWPPWYRPPFASRYSVTWSPDLSHRLTSPPSHPAPISVIIDLDSSVNPLSVFPTSNTSLHSASKPKSLHFTIGHSGAVFTFRSVEHLRLPDAVDHLVFLYGLFFRLARLKASIGLDCMDNMARQRENGDLKRYHEWILTAKCLLTHGVQLEIGSTVESRFIDPPAGYEEGERALGSTLSLESSSKMDSVQAAKSLETSESLNRIPEFSTRSRNSFNSEEIITTEYASQADQFPKVARSKHSESTPGLRNASSFISLDSDGYTLDDPSTIEHSDSFEILLPDDEALHEVFTNSFDEIVPEEVGIDVANSEEIDQHSTTVMDEEQGVNFPPWNVQRLMLDFTNLSIDADVTTVEARLWVGVGSVSFFNPDDIEEDHLDDTDTNSDCNDTYFDRPAFLITLRFGGDALPGQPQGLSSPYDGWLAVQVKMLQETTLYPVPTAWEVVEALLGHLTSRGGVRACHRVVTMGPGAGSIPLRSPPQLLDLTFCLERGHLVLDLTAKPGRWWRRSRGDSTLVQKQSSAPIQKIKLLQGFSASLNSDGVLEVRGAMPIDSLSSVSQSLFPTAIATVSCITSPPLPPRRPPPLSSHLRRHNPPPLTNSQASLVEENAKLRLMVERLNAQVLALTMDLTKFKTKYPS
ncbi:UHRF1-binding protein 1-like [Taenia crassiceps]|uniref:UHRF1-binding protein 1-like n=1 Tax=Taenia crassiceps TaxID=6207 RepID=A0ABR4QRG6_9CEST